MDCNDYVGVKNMKDIPIDYKTRYKEVQNENNMGNYEYSLKIANELLKEYPKYYFITKLLLGSIFWNMNNLDEAISAFQEIVIKSPNNEKISICLFHVLWRKGLRFEALEEMKRYLTNNKSAEYTEILDGITAKLHEKPIDPDI